LSFSILDVVKREKIPTVMTLHDYKIINPNYSLFRNGQVDEHGSRGQYRDTLLYNTLGSYPRSLVAMIEAYMRVWRFSGIIAKFIAPSRFMKSMCEDNGIPSDRITVVPNPFAVVSHKPITEDIESYVLFVGRLSEEKGIETILSAARRTPRIRYVLVGSGPLAEYVREVVKRDNMQNVGLVGQADSDMVEHFMSGASLVVVPSIWYENYPYVILEAKAAGKVVIASRIGGIPELLPDDCLVTLGSSESLSGAIELWMKKTPAERVLRGKELQHEIVVNNDSASYVQRILAVYADAVTGIK
jgi:glycosyltransferase involved in cell wall biosynthesis